MTFNKRLICQGFSPIATRRKGTKRQANRWDGKRNGSIESLEERRLLAVDFPPAVDLGSGLTNQAAASELMPLELPSKFGSTEDPQYAWTSDLLRVRTSERYTLSAWGVNVAEYNETPMQFASYDIDRQLILPEQVTKYELAVDTQLAARLLPGDTSLLLSNASGWSNQPWETADTRSLAWYGYRDSTGRRYTDYTYTRNVASDFDQGLWVPGGIEYDDGARAYRLTLREPWAGPKLAKGTAIRNAASGSLYNELRVAPTIETSGAWSHYTSTFGGRVWQQGNIDQQAFRPGTAFIQPVFVSVGPWDGAVFGLEQGADALCRYVAADQEDTAAAPPLGESQQGESLRQLGTAMLNFHDAFHQFPVRSLASNFGDDGEPLVSWRVHLLPFLGYENLYERFHLDEPWDSANNLPLLAEMPELFRNADDAADSTSTRLMTFYGPDAPFGSQADGRDQRGPRLGDFYDGAANTILVVEAGADRAVPWTKPEDLPFDILDPRSALGELTSGVHRAVLADGSLIELEAGIDPATLSALVTHQSTRAYRFGVLPDEELADAASLRERYRQLTGQLPPYDGRQHDLKSIAVAAIAYESGFRHFPANTFSTDGEPLLSWRVNLLPQLGLSNLYAQFRFDEPWDSPHNLALLDYMPDVFRSDSDSWDSTTTRVVNFTGPGAQLFSPQTGLPLGLRFGDIRDGISNTIMVIEGGPEIAVPWTKPADVPFETNNPLSPLGDVGSGFLAAYYDGSVHELPASISTDLLNALITFRGGEPIADPPDVASVPDFTILETAGDTVFYEMGADAFAVVLDRAPTRDVVLRIRTLLLTDHRSLRFTPKDWNVPQRVSVRDRDDFVADGDRTASITISVKARLTDNAYDDVPSQTVTATILDDETRSLNFRLIDDGDPGFSTAGDWRNFTRSGLGGDYHFSRQGDGSNTAAWTFDNLEPGIYRIAATWRKHVNRATDAPLSIFDGAAPLGTVRVNQQLAPGDFRASDASWENLCDVWTITGEQLVVTLSNAANGFVIADAIRIERVGDLPAS